jgi:hypothetical protein
MKHPLLLLICLLFLSWASFGQKKKKNTNESYPVINTLTIPGTAFLRPIIEDMEVKFDYKQINAPLPKFNILNYQNKNTNDEVLGSGGNLLLIMFNPTCEHCEDETRLLIQRIFMFKKSKILLVAAPMQTPNLAYFESNVNFSQYPSTITVAIDSAKIIEKLFTYKTLPQINIYDGKSRRLLKTYEGFVPIDSLREYIQ